MSISRQNKKVASIDLSGFPADAASVAGTQLHLSDLQSLPHVALAGLISRYALRLRPDGTRRHLVSDLCRFFLSAGAVIAAEGLLEDVGDHAMIRWPCYNMAEGPDDLFVSIGLVRDFSLQTGLQVACTLRAPHERDRYCGVEQIASIEGIPLADWKTAHGPAATGPWFVRQRLGARIELDGGHAYDGWYETHGKTHPEWFALQPDGTRHQKLPRERLCKSNPALWDEIARVLVEEFKADPKAAGKLLAVGIAPRDKTLDPVELAAWTAAARAVLNLHEAIARY
jgi:hypothetical protein